MKTVQRGFTLIELMIVVAIVGILAAIALPAYQDYLVRSRVTEPMARLSQAKTSVAEFYASRQTLPADSGQAGIDTGSTQYIASAGWDAANNRIEATISSGISQLTNDTIYLTANVNSTNWTIDWVCGTDAGSGKYKYVPSNCRNS